jgi:hypothetical protein
MKTEYISIIEISSIFGCQVRLTQNKVSLVRVVVNIDCNQVKVTRQRQLHNKINANMLLKFSKDFLRLENSFEVLCKLIALMFLATKDVLVYNQGHLKSPLKTRQ